MSLVVTSVNPCESASEKQDLIAISAYRADIAVRTSTAYTKNFLEYFRLVVTWEANFNTTELFPIPAGAFMENNLVLEFPLLTLSKKSSISDKIFFLPTKSSGLAGR